jgi:hypothetical protein
MEESSTVQINQFNNKSSVKNITYQYFIQQQKQNKKLSDDSLEIFKRKLRTQNYFEEYDDMNIIYHSTK